MVTPTEELKLLLNQFADKQVDLNDFKSAAIFLAQKGADLTIRDDRIGLSENTLLHHLILTNVDNRNDNEISELLQMSENKKTDLVNIKNGKSQTLLQLLNDNEIAELLQMNENTKTDLANVKNGKSQTPLQLLMDRYCNKIDLSFNGFKSTAILLARNGADLTVLDCRGNTLMHYLVLQNDNKIDELLKLNSKLINARNIYGSIPLMSLLGMGSGEEHTRVKISLLAEMFENLFINYEKIQTVSRGLLKITKDIINYKEEQEITKEFIGSLAELFKKLKYLINSNSNNRNDIKINRLLLENEKIIVNIESMQRSLLEKRQNNKIILMKGIKKLIKLGSDLNTRDDLGRTLLHTACIGGEQDIVHYLASKGLDIAAKTKKNETMLHLCVCNRNQDLWEWFYKKGIDIDTKDNNQQTTLHQAAYQKNTTMVQWLIEKNADLNVKDKNGDTPLSLARKSNYKKIADLLLQAGALDKKLGKSDEMKGNTSKTGSTDFKKKQNGSEEKSREHTKNEQGSAPSGGNKNTQSTETPEKKDNVKKPFGADDIRNSNIYQKGTKTSKPEEKNNQVKNVQLKVTNEKSEALSQKVKKEETERKSNEANNKKQSPEIKKDLKLNKVGYLATFKVSEEELKARGLVSVIDRMYELYQKINDFDDKLNKAQEAKNPKDTELYKVAKTATENVHAFMKKLIEQHSGDLKEFKLMATCVLGEKNSLPDQDKKIVNAGKLREDVALLKTHRGSKELLVNLLAACLFLVPYIFAAAIKGNFTVFKVATGAGSIADKLFVEINRIDNSKK